MKTIRSTISALEVSFHRITMYNRHLLTY